MGMIRSVFGSTEATVRGSIQLARVAFAGALIGITGIMMAVIMIAAASAEGADANPVVSRAVPRRLWDPSWSVRCALRRRSRLLDC
jgi:hypothetical protein